MYHSIVNNFDICTCQYLSLNLHKTNLNSPLRLIALEITLSKSIHEFYVSNSVQNVLHIVRSTVVDCGLQLINRVKFQVAECKYCTLHSL